MMIDPTPETPAVLEHSEVDLLRIDLENQKNTIANLRTKAEEHRHSVRRLYSAINDYISDNELDFEDDIPLASLDEFLTDIFNDSLTFTKVYEVQVSYSLDVTFEIEAKDEQEARDIAEDIGISSDPVFDHSEDPTECVIDNIRVGYVSRKDR